ncbi:hypothetical protein [Microvirga thermotolerans]|uniref:hypothetical protein n=1 Tax=Microvirga thermotolerans TaxID=2651334 RepID=UPI001884395F|nr:hypothetical protein [Microvirga thermotolerans]
MSIGSRTSRGEGRHDRLLGRVLIAGAVLCLVGAGGLLWWRQGAAVFSDVVSAALAWCF